MRPASVALLGLQLSLGSSVGGDPCAARSDVPCLHVPSCASGFASSSMLADQFLPIAPPKKHTALKLCHSATGLHIHVNATDDDVFNTAKKCNADVFSLGDVIEAFIAPVESPWDNPVRPHAATHQTH